jgi:hypothetical protein
MAKHLVMDFTGHTTIEFDKTDPVALKEAMARFEALVGKPVVGKGGRLAGYTGGHTAATRKTGETDYTVIRDPSQQLDETLFVPHMKGG